MNAALEVANQIVQKFAHAGDLLKSPMFIAGVIEAGFKAATAKDDEERRGIIQIEVLKLEREFL